MKSYKIKISPLKDEFLNCIALITFVTNYFFVIIKIIFASRFKIRYDVSIIKSKFKFPSYNLTNLMVSSRYQDFFFDFMLFLFAR